MAGLFSPTLVSVGGMRFFEMLAEPALWLIAGAVMSLVGVGLVVWALNLRQKARGEDAAEN